MEKNESKQNQLKFYCIGTGECVRAWVASWLAYTVLERCICAVAKTERYHCPLYKGNKSAQSVGLQLWLTTSLFFIWWEKDHPLRLEKVSGFVQYYHGLGTQIYLHIQSYCNKDWNKWLYLLVSEILWFNTCQNKQCSKCIKVEAKEIPVWILEEKVCGRPGSATFSAWGPGKGMAHSSGACLSGGWVLFSARDAALPVQISIDI